MPSVDCGSNVILISKIWLWCLDPCCVCILPSSFPLPHRPLLLGVILGGDLIHILVLKPFGMFSWISFTDVYLGGRLGTSYAAYEISFSSFLLLKIGSQGLSFLMHFLWLHLPLGGKWWEEREKKKQGDSLLPFSTLRALFASFYGQGEGFFSLSPSFSVTVVMSAAAAALLLLWQECIFGTGQANPSGQRWVGSKSFSLLSLS